MGSFLKLIAVPVVLGFSYKRRQTIKAMRHLGEWCEQE
jgi:hypothetical protein